VVPRAANPLHPQRSSQHAAEQGACQRSNPARRSIRDRFCWCDLLLADPQNCNHSAACSAAPSCKLRPGSSSASAAAGAAPADPYASDPGPSPGGSRVTRLVAKAGKPRCRPIRVLDPDGDAEATLAAGEDDGAVPIEKPAKLPSGVVRRPHFVGAAPCCAPTETSTRRPQRECPAGLGTVCLDRCLGVGLRRASASRGRGRLKGWDQR
jgi:hypothetical protein